MATKTEPDEKDMANALQGFIEECDQHDLAWTYTRDAVGFMSDRDARRVVKALRERGYLKHYRGGVDDDGYVCGGSGYAPTNAGRAWLAEIDKQQELPL